MRTSSPAYAFAGALHAGFACGVRTYEYNPKPSIVILSAAKDLSRAITTTAPASTHQDPHSLITDYRSLITDN